MRVQFRCSEYRPVDGAGFVVKGLPLDAELRGLYVDPSDETRLIIEIDIRDEALAAAFVKHGADATLASMGVRKP